MSTVGCTTYRQDIDEYIKEHGQVSECEIYQKFGSGRDIISFELELNILVDKSKTAFELTDGEYYIDRVNSMFICKFE